MAEPEKAPDPAEAVASAAPAVGDATAAATAPAMDGAADRPPEPAELSGEELKAIEHERIGREEEARERELERMRFEDVRTLEKERKLEKEEEERLLSARLRMQAECQKEEINAMRLESLELQKRVVALQKKRKSANHVEQEDCQETQYYARLKDWNETKDEFNRMKGEFDKKIDNLRDMLQEKAEESNARHESLMCHFWKVARDSQDILSFRRIPRRLLLELEHEEWDSIIELQAVRTRGRQLKKQLAKLEVKLALKDQLQLETRNLCLVDYEQLKMENQALEEKILMRNETVSTLRKKAALLVHTLQHTREKLQFLVVGCEGKGQELANANKALRGGKIKKSHLKTSIVNINRTREAIERGIVNINSPMLWDDMDNSREDVEAEEQTFQGLKKRYQDLTVKIQLYKNRLYGLKALSLPMKKMFTRDRSPKLHLLNARREGQGEKMR